MFKTVRSFYRYLFIMDVSKTLVMMETEIGKVNPYDIALAMISSERFGGIEMKMSMAEDGQLFPDHIARVIETALMRAGLMTGVENFRKTAQEIIDEQMRNMLVKMFSERRVLAAPGLKDFLIAFRDRPLGGIITGDLRAVAGILMTNNACGDLRIPFPDWAWTCGDDHGLVSRIDQLRSTYLKVMRMPAFAYRIVLIDDAAKGISAMAEFVGRMKIRIHTRVIGVLTGNSGKEELEAAGADLVLPSIGAVTPYELEQLW